MVDYTLVRTKEGGGWWAQLADTDNLVRMGKGLILSYNRRWWTPNSFTESKGNSLVWTKEGLGKSRSSSPSNTKAVISNGTFGARKITFQILAHELCDFGFSSLCFAHKMWILLVTLGVILRMKHNNMTKELCIQQVLNVCWFPSSPNSLCLAVGEESPRGRAPNRKSSWEGIKSWPRLSLVLGVQVSLIPSHDPMSEPTWLPLLLLMGTVFLILLSLCSQFTA